MYYETDSSGWLDEPHLKVRCYKMDHLIYIISPSATSLGNLKQIYNFLSYSAHLVQVFDGKIC